MKILGSTLYGALLSTLLVAVNGITAVQVIGQRSGAVFNLNNDVVAVNAIQVPVLTLLASAVISCVLVYGVTADLRAQPTSFPFVSVISFIVVTCALVVGSFFLEGSKSTDSGILPGWRGWLEEGGSSLATLTILVFSIGFLGKTWLARLRGNETNSLLGPTERAEQAENSPRDG